MSRLNLTLDELRDAQSFHDRVRAAPLADQIAVGQDHHNRLDAAVRAVVAAHEAVAQHKDAAGVDAPLMARARDEIGNIRQMHLVHADPAEMALRLFDLERLLWGEAQSSSFIAAPASQGDAEPIHQWQDDEDGRWRDAPDYEVADFAKHGFQTRVVYLESRPASDDAGPIGYLAPADLADLKRNRNVILAAPNSSAKGTAARIGVYAEPRLAHDDARTGWDRYYDGAPSDIKRRLSLHDFKRLGNLFKEAFPERKAADGEASC